MVGEFAAMSPELKNFINLFNITSKLTITPPSSADSSTSSSSSWLPKTVTLWLSSSLSLTGREALSLSCEATAGTAVTGLAAAGAGGTAAQGGTAGWTVGGMATEGPPVGTEPTSVEGALGGTAAVGGLVEETAFPSRASGDVPCMLGSIFILHVRGTKVCDPGHISHIL